MDKKQFKLGIAVLTGAYPQSKADFVNMETLKVWFEVLKDLDGDKFLDSIANIAKTHKFLPSISEIREAVLGISSCDTESKAMLAWEQVLNAIRRAGYVRSVKFTDRVIHNAVKSLGGWIYLCSLPTEKDLTFFRIAFLKAYQGLYKAYLEGSLPEIDYLEGQNEIENQGKFPGLVDPPVMIGHKEHKMLNGSQLNV